MFKIGKIKILFLILSFGLLFGGCSNIHHKHKVLKDGWVETIGTITESAKMNDGSYAYTIQYEVVGKDARNADGDIIQGALKQHHFGLDKKAIAGQELRLKYRQEEPMFYELLEDIKYEDTSKL